MLTNEMQSLVFEIQNAEDTVDLEFAAIRLTDDRIVAITERVSTAEPTAQEREVLTLLHRARVEIHARAEVLGAAPALDEVLRLVDGWLERRGAEAAMAEVVLDVLDPAWVPTDTETWWARAAYGEHSTSPRALYREQRLEALLGQLRPQLAALADELDEGPPPAGIWEAIVARR